MLALYNTSSTPYMGRDEVEPGTTELDEPMQPDRPFEAAADGCPGAWYRTRFVESLLPYLRRPVDGGGRVPRQRFDQAPWQVQEAVEYFEGEQARASAHLIDERERRRRSARELAAATAAMGPRTATAKARSR
jgi:hypothetical protein